MPASPSTICSGCLHWLAGRHGMTRGLDGATAPGQGVDQASRTPLVSRPAGRLGPGGQVQQRRSAHRRPTTRASTPDRHVGTPAREPGGSRRRSVSAGHQPHSSSHTALNVGTIYSHAADIAAASTRPSASSSRPVAARRRSHWWSRTGDRTAPQAPASPVSRRTLARPGWPSFCAGSRAAPRWPAGAWRPGRAGPGGSAARR